jgi:hypothetical protein
MAKPARKPVRERGEIALPADKAEQVVDGHQQQGDGERAEVEGAQRVEQRQPTDEGRVAEVEPYSGDEAGEQFGLESLHRSRGAGEASAPPD